MEVTFGCFPNEIALPPKGAELDLWLGYDNLNQKVGKYIVDECEVSGAPTQMSLIGKAAQMEGQKRSALQSMKTRTWPNGTTIGTMVSTIASDHGLVASVATVLQAISLPAYHQRHESDLHLLSRVAEQYDATFKAVEGRLVLMKRGSGASVSGQALPQFVHSA